jgi:hypothetical protein
MLTMPAASMISRDRVRRAVGERLRRWGSRAWPGLAIGALFCVLAYRFCSIYFPLDARKVGGPGDFEPYVAMDWIVAKTLAERHELPLWNPYVHSGLPLIGDAYISFFNPSIVLPLLLFGPINGGKVAVVTAVALAGMGQYWLSRVLGHSRIVAVVAGVLGLTAGSLVARFASGFNFGQSMQHAWLAFTLASFILALRHARPGAIALAALCYALLFHAGNVYLWLVLTAVMVVFTAGYGLALDLTPRGPRLRIAWRPVLAGAGVAAVAALLSAVQGLPMLEMRRLAEKPIDLAFRGTQPPLATLLNFVIADQRFWERELFGASDLGWGVHYAYLGAGLFVFLLFLVPAFWHRPNRDLPLLVLGVALSIAWASARHTFMWEVWQRWDMMRQLRFWSTATGVTTILLIPLALAGADYLWRQVIGSRKALDRLGPRLVWAAPQLASLPRPAPAPRWSLGLMRPVLAALLILLLWHVAADPWRVNQRLWHVIPYDEGADQVLAWLGNHDRTAYTIRNQDNIIHSFASVAHIKHEIQVLNSIWLFKPRAPANPQDPDGGQLVPSPKYIVTRKGAPAPPDGTLIMDLPGGAVYAGPPGLPFAFVTDPQRPPYGPAAGASALARGVIQDAPARFDGPNRIIVQVPPNASPAQTTLVIMQTWVRGWSARDVDGATQPVDALGGFLAIHGVRPGQVYVLSFRPPIFVLGALLSGAGLVALVALVWLELAGWPARLRLLAGGGQSPADRLAPRQRLIGAVLWPALRPPASAWMRRRRRPHPRPLPKAGGPRAGPQDAR